MRLGNLILFERETISEGGTPYLVRYRIVDTPLFGVYLHHILRSNSQRHLHCHPFSWVSIMLWGRYGEVGKQHFQTACGSMYGPEKTIERRAPSIAFRRAEHAHRLVLEKPCWTLVLRGPRRREWGFHTERGWVEHREYLRGETKEQNKRSVSR